MKIILATHNPHKREELLSVLREALNDRIEILTLDDVHPFIPEIDETGSTLEENATIKSKAVFEATRLPSLADDTGLEVAALNGAPGVYSARYAGERVTYQDNVNKLLRELSGKSNREAKFRTVLSYIDADGNEYQFDGLVEGAIIENPRGANGFGYDPVFAPKEDADARTFAEMNSEEKRAISHRGRALQKFAEWLRSAIDQPV